MRGVRTRVRLPDGAIVVSTALGELRARGYALDRAFVSYYSPSQEMYVVCGLDPLPESCLIPRYDCDYGQLSRVRLKFAFPDQAGVNQPVVQPAQKSVGKRRTGAGKTGRTRTKERRIGDVIEKVAFWRELYSGVHSSDGRLIKFSLEEAADKVGISKKSLDDYLLQLRYGKKYKFDFDTHKDDKFGMLRMYVKRKKEEERTGLLAVPANPISPAGSYGSTPGSTLPAGPA